MLVLSLTADCVSWLRSLSMAELNLASPNSASLRFRFALAPLFMESGNIMDLFWISNGLREFWEKAIVLKLAARACSRHFYKPVL